MRIFSVFLAAALLTTTAPGFAQEKKPDLSKVPEAILLQSLNNMAVCIRAYAHGQIKLVQLVKQIQKEDGAEVADDHRQIVNKALSDVNDIRDIMAMQDAIAFSVVEPLMNVYNLTEDDLNDRLKPIMQATDSSMADLFKDIDDPREVSKIMEDKANKCMSMTKKAMNDMKKYIE